jgi:hypothetical protein
VHEGLGELNAAREAADAAARWFTAAGGGDGAVLTAYLAALLSSEGGESHRRARLEEVLETARVERDAEVESLVLAALGRPGVA